MSRNPALTYTPGRSATSGSRLFVSIRSGASVNQLFAWSVVPRLARMMRLFCLSMGLPQGCSTLLDGLY